MAKSRIVFAGAALAASSLQAFASLPQAPPPTVVVIASPTGLTAVDLIVSRDGKLAIDVRGQGVKLACNSGSCARDSC